MTWYVEIVLLEKSGLEVQRRIHVVARGDMDMPTSQRVSRETTNRVILLGRNHTRVTQKPVGDETPCHWITSELGLDSEL